MSTSPLPNFKYHPDPIGTGAISATTATCECCGKARGYEIAHIYAEANLEHICPWCVADGSAAAKFDADMVSSVVGNVPEHISAEAFDELNHRTPGYVSWQGERWLTHCGDACEYHGDLSAEDLQQISSEAEADFLRENDWLDDWPSIKASYEPLSQSMALYKFVCRHCGTWQIGIDFD